MVDRGVDHRQGGRGAGAPRACNTAPLLFHQSGGCCDRVGPECATRSASSGSDRQDVFLGAVAGCNV